MNNKHSLSLILEHTYPLVLSTECIIYLDKFNTEWWWFSFRVELIFVRDVANPKMFLTSKVVKNDPQIIITLLLPRLILNL